MQFQLLGPGYAIGNLSLHLETLGSCAYTNRAMIENSVLQHQKERGLVQQAAPQLSAQCLAHPLLAFLPSAAPHQCYSFLDRETHLKAHARMFTQRGSHNISSALFTYIC